MTVFGFSNEEWWVSVGQRATELRAVKVGGEKIFCWSAWFEPTLPTCNFAVLWPTKTHSTSLERSKPLLLIQTLSKSLAALLMYFISFQSTLISIGFISKGVVFVGPICIYAAFWFSHKYSRFTTRWFILQTAIIWWTTKEISEKKNLVKLNYGRILVTLIRGGVVLSPIFRGQLDIQFFLSYSKFCWHFWQY